MIQEAYVTFDTAKLLKEKGFTLENCHTAYDDNGNFFWYGDYSKDRKNVIDAPTQQMAMRWLREVHNLCIEPYRTASGYLYTISKIWTGSEIYSDEFNGDDEDSGQWTTYEKACEAAIKYCLEHLI